MAFNGTVTVPLVRVPRNDHVRIEEALDMGVEGIMAPMVRTIADCRELVHACKYPPPSGRGFGPRGRLEIEDVATINVLDEYLKTPGIDAIALGPNHL
jgi:2-keto-3-deoxy-L-rhamnonate aldolase RhmA